MKKSSSFFEISKFNLFYKGGTSYGAPAGEATIPSFTKEFGRFKFLTGSVASSSLLELPNFLFFEPDFYFEGSKWKLVENSPSREFKVNYEKLVSVRRVLKSNISFKFDINISWKQFVFVEKKLDFHIQGVDFEKFLLQLDSLKYSNYFYLLPSLENERHTFDVVGDKLIKNSEFDLKGSVLFFHESSNTETVSFVFSRAAAPDSRLKKKVVSIKLSSNMVGAWSSDRSYIKDDIVYYEKNFYICLKKTDSADVLPPSEGCEFWALFKDFGSSFLRSEYGRSSIDMFKKTLNNFVEKAIGDEVFLIFWDECSTPILNSFFLYSGKRFRVVSVTKNIINGRRKLTVKGVELLSITWDSSLLSQGREHSFSYDIKLNKDGNKTALTFVYPTSTSLRNPYKFDIRVEEGCYV